MIAYMVVDKDDPECTLYQQDHQYPIFYDKVGAEVWRKSIFRSQDNKVIEVIISTKKGKT